MELDEMKNMWQRHEQQLSHNRMLNEKIITNMLKDKSKNELQKMSNAELAGAALCGILILLFAMMAERMNTDILLVCYVFALGCIILSLSASVYKINFLSNTDLGKPVTETTNRMQRFRLFIIKERLISLLLTPLLVVTILAVVTYWIYDRNIFNEVETYAWRVGAALALGIPAMLFIYRKLYFDSIKQINSNLQELEEFKRA
jgi:hypothetical protein